VYGDQPSLSAGFAEASRSPVLTRIDIATGNRREERPANIAKTTVVEVWVERLTPAQGLDFGWHRVHDAVVTPIRPLRLATKRRAKRSRKTSASVATTFSTKQRTRAVELVKSQRYAELANEGLIAVLLRTPLWDGTVTLPSAPAPDDRHRIVVAEYEEYLTDDIRSPEFPNVAYDTPPESKGRRMVFVEHIELDLR
jgi:hypothetical protein